MESLTGRVRKWGLPLCSSNCSPVLCFLFFPPTPFLSIFVVVVASYFPLEFRSAWIFPSTNSPQCIRYRAFGFLTLGNAWVSWPYPKGLHLLGVLFSFWCWASFLVSPVAPQGFFGLQIAFEMPCKVLRLGKL